MGPPEFNQKRDGQVPDAVKKLFPDAQLGTLTFGRRNLEAFKVADGRYVAKDRLPSEWTIIGKVTGVKVEEVKTWPEEDAPSEASRKSRQASSDKRFSEARTPDLPF